MAFALYTKLSHGIAAAKACRIWVRGWVMLRIRGLGPLLPSPFGAIAAAAHLQHGADAVADGAGAGGHAMAVPKALISAVTRASRRARSNDSPML